MSKLQKIGGINIAILLVYFLLLKATANQTEYLSTFLFTAFAITAQVTVNTILSLVYFFSKKSDLGKAYLISAGLVLVIGFPACVGGASV